MGGDGGCRVGEVRAGTTSPMPDHKGFKLQYLGNFQKFSTSRVKGSDDAMCLQLVCGDGLVHAYCGIGNVWRETD